jgi:protein-tyrosine-phosphatase
VPAGPPIARPPQSVLFACRFNAIRSPMAAALFRHLLGKGVYVGSAGVRRGELDPFAVTVLKEIGLDIGKHRPQTFEDLDENEGFNFDLIVTLSPEAHHRALDLTRTNAAEVEYWPTPDPSDVIGNRDQMLDAYRALREQLALRIKERFVLNPEGRE